MLLEFFYDRWGLGKIANCLPQEVGAGMVQLDDKFVNDILFILLNDKEKVKFSRVEDIVTIEESRSHLIADLQNPRIFFDFALQLLSDRISNISRQEKQIQFSKHVQYAMHALLWRMHDAIESRLVLQSRGLLADASVCARSTLEATFLFFKILDEQDNYFRTILKRAIRREYDFFNEPALDLDVADLFASNRYQSIRHIVTELFGLDLCNSDSMKCVGEWCEKEDRLWLSGIVNAVGRLVGDYGGDKESKIIKKMFNAFRVDGNMFAHSLPTSWPGWVEYSNGSRRVTATKVGVSEAPGSLDILILAQVISCLAHFSDDIDSEVAEFFMLLSIAVNRIEEY